MTRERTVGRRRLAAGAALAIGAAGLAGCAGGDEGTASADSTTTTAVTVPVATTAPTSAAHVARAFLAAWTAGDLQGAAELTDDPGAARAALGEVADLPATVQATPLPMDPDLTRVGFTLALTVGGNGYGGTATYHSALNVRSAGGGWKVAWSPAVVHPRLTPTFRLQVGVGPAKPAAPAGGSGALDRKGRPITAQAFPSLTRALSMVGNGPVVETLVPTLEIVDRSGGPGADVATIDAANAPAPAGPSGRSTTIDADIQGAAERAVAKAPGTAGLAVIEPSTGHILAMASNPPTSGAAVTNVRPASTFKVLVTSTLLRNGYTPASKAGCPEKIVVDGHPGIYNAEAGETRPGADLLYSFSVSCNTAFVIEGMKLPKDAVTNEAHRYYGLGQQWDIGVNQPNAYANVPVPQSDKGHAELMFGEHPNVTLSPLALASVAGTVQSGQFRQPVIVPDAPRKATAPALGPGVADNLRRLMRSVVSTGTATTLRGLGDVGAKTGTADTGATNTGWMIAFRGDLAVAVYVTGIPKSAYGNDTAGPIVADLLRSV